MQQEQYNTRKKGGGQSALSFIHVKAKPHAEKEVDELCNTLNWWIGDNICRKIMLDRWYKFECYHSTGPPIDRDPPGPKTDSDQLINNIQSGWLTVRRPFFPHV